MTLTITPYELGPFATNTYLVAAGASCWVVDPTWAVGVVLDDIAAGKLALERILLTHGHCDHIAGIGEVKRVFPAVPVCCPAGDAAMLADPMANLSGTFGLPLTFAPPDELLHPRDGLALGHTRWEVLDTSGHTPGGVSFHCPAEKVVLTGDALFAGGVGRTDFPGGDWQLLAANIRRNLLTLPAETAVYPGHGPNTTIGREKTDNPFL